MRALLVDRLGFERLHDDAAGTRIIVPRRFEPGQSEFHWFGPLHRGGEELIEYREVDDMPEELKRVHGTVDYLRKEVRRLEGRCSHLGEENGQLALELKRLSRKGFWR